jgi:hypothetical protein
MFSKRKPKNKNRFYKTSGKYRLNRWDYLLLGLILFLGLFVASVAQRWQTEPLAQSQETSAWPEVFRVQILNACGARNLAEATAQSILSQNPSGGCYFDVVDKDNFSTFEVQESFVIYSEGELKAAAAQLCRILGLPASQVVQQDFGENFLDLDLKAVLGQDYSNSFRKE